MPIRMSRYLVSIAALLVTAHVFAAPAPEVIKQIKKCYRRTELMTDGQPKAIILIPDGKEYRELAQAIAAKVELPIKVHSEFTDRDKESNMVLLGGAFTNQAAMPLYIRKYIACDLDYPGPDGYVVRTVCDPWGTGRNVIMLGGSDLDGVRMAVDKFIDVLPAGGTKVLPHLIEIHFRDRALLDKKQMDRMRAHYRKGYVEKKVLWYGATGDVHKLAYLYYLTGIEDYAETYVSVATRWMDEYDRWSSPAQIATPKYKIPDVIRSFDLIEESPSLDDKLKLRMTNLLYDYVSRLSRHGRIRDWKPGTVRTTGGHAVARSVLFGSDYFEKYYRNVDLTRIRQGMKDLKIGMDTQKRTYGILSDSGYTASYPPTSMAWALWTGDMFYFDSGNARRWCQYAAMCIDNLRSTHLHWAYPHTLTIPAWHYKDGRYLWLWNWKQRSKTNCVAVSGWDLRFMPYSFRPDIQPVFPTEFTGINVFPVHPIIYDNISRKHGKPPVPQGKAFHQMTFRTGFQPHEQYLRLGGINRGMHYGRRGNSIESFTDDTAKHLIAGKWGSNELKYHNNVMVVRDGQFRGEQPILCSLDLKADLHGTGFTSTTLPGYNGMDWTRHIVWNKERYFIVLDEMTARGDADFGLYCQWRSTCPGAIRNHRFTTEPRRPALIVDNADGARLSTFRQDNIHVHRQSVMRKMSPGDRYLFMNMVRSKPGGAPLRAWRRWQSTPATAYADFDNAASGKGGLCLKSVGNKWQCLVQDIDGLLPGKEYRLKVTGKTNGKVGGCAEIRGTGTQGTARCTFSETDWATREVRFKCAEGRQNSVELWLLHSTYKSPDGIAWFDDIELTECDGTDGRNLIKNAGFEPMPEDMEGNKDYSFKRINDSCAAIICGDDVRFVGLARNTQMKLADSLSVRGDLFHVSPGRYALANALEFHWAELIFRSNVPISIEHDLVSGNGVVNADREASVTLRAKSVMLDAKAVGVRPVESRITFTVSPGHHTIQTTNWPEDEALVKAMQTDAKRILKAATGHGPPTVSGSGARLKELWRWPPEQPADPIRCLCTSDLDGDGEKEILTGTASGKIHALASDGKRLWSFASGGAVNVVRAEDVNGDGKKEVFAGSDDFKIYALDHHGDTLWTFCNRGRVSKTQIGGTYRPGDKYVVGDGEFLSMRIADLDGDGQKEIIGASAAFKHGAWRVFGSIYVLDPHGKLKWDLFQYGGRPISMDVADILGTGKKQIALGTAGTYGVHFYLFDFDGKVIQTWRSTYGDKLVKLGCLPQPSLIKTELRDGSVAIYDTQNPYALRWKYDTAGFQPAPPLLTDINGDGTQEIILGSANGNLYVLSEKAKGRLLFRKAVDRAISTVRPADTNRDGEIELIIGCDEGDILLLSAKGDEMARTVLPAGVVALATLGATANGKTGIVAATEEGSIHLLSLP